jgi:tetratricopeptide (TPR) repeat protein
VSLYFFTVRPLTAAKQLIDGLSHLSTQPLTAERVEASHEILRNAIGKKSFLTTEIREQMSTRAQAIARSELVDSEEARAFVDNTEAQLETQIAEYSHDVRAQTFRASLYISDDKNERGIEIARDLIGRAPTRQLFYFILGQGLWQEEQYDEAVEPLRTAYELDPTFPDAQENLAAALIYANRTEEAENLISQLFEQPYPPSTRITQAYLNRGRYADALRSFESLVQDTPKNLQYRINLARLYIFFRRDADAIAQLERAGELDPRITAAMDALIGQIRNGTIERDLQ